MRLRLDGRGAATDTQEEDTEEFEEGLFWEVAAQVAAQRIPEQESEVFRQRSTQRLPEARSVAAMQTHQGERSFVPMPQASRGFQSPVLLSPRIAHRVIDLTGRSFSSASQPVPETPLWSPGHGEAFRASSPPRAQPHQWPADRRGPTPRQGQGQGCSRLRKSNSAEARGVPKVGLAAAGCTIHGSRRRTQADVSAPRTQPTAVSSNHPQQQQQQQPQPPQQRTLTRTTHSQLMSTAPSSPQTGRQAVPSRAAPQAPPLPSFGNAQAQACTPVALGQCRWPSTPVSHEEKQSRQSASDLRRPSSPLSGSVRPGGVQGPTMASVPLPAVHTWVPPMASLSGVTSSPPQTARPARSSLTSSRIVEEDTLAASGNASTIAPAEERQDTLAASGNASTIAPAEEPQDEHQDESFGASEVAGSMIISSQDQASGTAAHAPDEQANSLEAGRATILVTDGQADRDSVSDNSSLDHEGLVNETRLIYPQPARISCAGGQPVQGMPIRPSGGHLTAPVAVYYGREPPAQVSVATTASTSTGLAESEGTSDAAALDGWCRGMGLPEVLLQRLRDERVQCPDHLIHCDKEDIKKLTEGLRIGDKISFINAVQQLRDCSVVRA